MQTDDRKVFDALAALSSVSELASLRHNQLVGTMLCNYGRRCGTLRVAGKDVGVILMREGLAKPYAYRLPHPPVKPHWY